MSTQKDIEILKNAVRDVPDFPKKGIVFKDITTLLQNPQYIRMSINALSDLIAGKKIDKIIGIESRGFIFGAPIAYKLGTGFIPVRKKGKLPYKTVSVTYDLEYGTDTLEMHEDAIEKGDRVVIIDDLLATGGTAAAAAALASKQGAEIAGFVCMIELSNLKGREKLRDLDVLSLIKY